MNFRFHSKNTVNDSKNCDILILAVAKRFIRSLLYKNRLVSSANNFNLAPGYHSCKLKILMVPELILGELLT